MGRGLILDTDILIAFERGPLAPEVFDQDDLAVVALTIAEFRTGIEMGDSSLRDAREQVLSALTGALQVLDDSPRTAFAHARQIAAVRRAGRPRGPHDLIIAAHAAQTGRTIVSRDAAARFGGLPGVSAIGH